MHSGESGRPQSFQRINDLLGTGHQKAAISSVEEDAAIRQIGALPYRIEPDGSVRIMLITSRGSGRWIIPKGNPMFGRSAHGAAAREAYEEAGVRGIISAASIGSFGYVKRPRDRRQRNLRVSVYPLLVRVQADTWPEQHERGTAWFSLADAVTAVAEPELKALIAGFQVPKQPSGWADRGWRFPSDLLRWFRTLPTIRY